MPTAEEKVHARSPRTKTMHAADVRHGFFRGHGAASNGIERAFENGLSDVTQRSSLRSGKSDSSGFNVGHGQNVGWCQGVDSCDKPGVDRCRTGS